MRYLNKVKNNDYEIGVVTEDRVADIGPRLDR